MMRVETAVRILFEDGKFLARADGFDQERLQLLASALRLCEREQSLGLLWLLFALVVVVFRHTFPSIPGTTWDLWQG